MQCLLSPQSSPAAAVAAAATPHLHMLTYARYYLPLLSLPTLMKQQLLPPPPLL
jgi:hypothetical protein